MLLWIAVVIGAAAVQTHQQFYLLGLVAGAARSHQLALGEPAHGWPDAERDLEKALELNPNEPELLNYLGYSWIDRNERLPDHLARAGLVRDRHHRFDETLFLRDMLHEPADAVVAAACCVRYDELDALVRPPVGGERRHCAKRSGKCDERSRKF